MKYRIMHADCVKTDTGVERRETLLPQEYIHVEVANVDIRRFAEAHRGQFAGAAYLIQHHSGESVVFLNRNLTRYIEYYRVPITEDY